MILAHDYEDAGERTPLTIEAGFAHLASERYAGIEFIVDLKLPGYEERVVDALNVAGLRDRALVSSTYKESLVLLRAYDAGLTVGWSVPRARRDYTSSILMKIPALVVLRVMKRTLPRQARAALQEGLCHAVMAHWRLVTPRTRRGGRRRGRRPLRLDGGPRPADQRAEDARGDGRDHERPAPVRSAAVICWVPPQGGITRL